MIRDDRCGVWRENAAPGALFALSGSRREWSNRLMTAMFTAAKSRRSDRAVRVDATDRMVHHAATLEANVKTGRLRIPTRR